MTHKASLSNFNLSILWFGAAVSLAEILTGALLAPLGLGKALLAIIIGHLIGGGILWLAGAIGTHENLAAIESSKLSFGKYGLPLFAILNVVQLIGWTAVMISSGASALGGVLTAMPTLNSITSNGSMLQILLCLFIAILIAVWIGIGFDRLKKLNLIAVTGLFLVSIYLGFKAFSGGVTPMLSEETLSFGLALELSIIMPLSWLPLISDYTQYASSKKSGPIASAFSYTVGSIFMYAIGLGAALYAGTSDIGELLTAAGLPVLALLVISLSTVTTTFLDVYSGAISFITLKKANEKTVALIICGIGALLAIMIPTTYYESFLYLIGSAFAPMFAILLTDYFLLKRRRGSDLYSIQNLILWALGAGLYQYFLKLDTPIGNSLPIMLILMAIKLIISPLQNKKSIK